MQSIKADRTGSTADERAPGFPSASARRKPNTLAQRGQVLALFVLSIFVLTGFVAIVIDVSWYWSNTLRVQRAADAAALAGAVDLPVKPGTAGSHTLGYGIGDAFAEAAKNGYSDGIGGVTVTPVQDSVAKTGGNGNQMDVTISAPVHTFFMRIFGVQTITATRTSKALFTLPIPMGSPENYYGVFGPVRGGTFTGTSTQQTNTGWLSASNWQNGAWTNPNRADANNNNQFATSPTANSSSQYWNQFGFSFTPTVNSIDGIEVRTNALLGGSGGNTSNCKLEAYLSWDNGGTYTALNAVNGVATLTPTEALYTLGSTSTKWGNTWTTAQLADGQFRLKLNWNNGANNATCSSTRLASVDTLEVRVTYTNTTTTTTPPADHNLTGPGPACLNGVANCYQDTGGQFLNPRGFWATMNTEGAANVNGDAYQPFYDTAGSTAAKTCPSSGNACYDAYDYYNYAVYMPPNTTGGYVYIYDPVFCSTTSNGNTDPKRGTGDRWFSGSNPVSSWYELFDTRNTPYDITDDTLITTSGTKFRGIAASDSSMLGSGGSECKQTDTVYMTSGQPDGRNYHDSWYLLNPSNPLTGGPDGTTYRLHTTSSVPPGQTDASGVNQKNTDGEQSFAIFASDTEGGSNPALLPDVYGLGAMQMFTPLTMPGPPSEFYLAQVPAFYAGKTLEINLWDPGDTSPLSASLAIEIPTASGWSATNVTWTAVQGTTNSAAGCVASSGSGTSIVTATPASRFNGCWLTIDVVIPGSPTPYTAEQGGWWKIKYTMTGTGTSSDVTTWTAAIKGNPVHLVVP